MIYDNRLLKVICAPHVSEKTSAVMEKNNILVLKVDKKATKAAIKQAILQLFEVKVKEIHTIIVKGKTKRHGKRIGFRSNWKKAYITLYEGQNFTLINGAK
ncbi:50S ribosomal protein L23 [Candidatus Palibaumannia cicadellinicola]|uniref:Large ribosomal subunit protein uL23 n=1 Tax=Baumannia cicadellinicola subsp. Homalodisca coagulata TaxID=374463 RepID=RL23_BAUCH|nr:50S ribosomal protein L23 [Candidatus Baumannia cicadellinicola]Q1LTD6.1 RecName: Full=Large ribosomal subunit protein uL23; AltName: Full=50S ribosomal protein L23 [Baumannia cicadellinicola str. Hc (Homalodisca coagulata)]ABF13954.1 ribosomal protein L23 [Baumannia cicadellinicola str. Hc (Homalodisca coagulata)]MCJ7462240.1 50S ribosomal protein L23 [Candidatus Baumannia cicadellinicola]MCJ7462758.1 50S ribosomal protein L23 [Candidatus Baumannia cicadellinicola]